MKHATSYSRRQLDPKKRKDLPPPLFPEHTEVHHKESFTDSPVFENIAPGSPGVEPCPTSCTSGIESSQLMSHITAKRLSEEEIRRRSYAKVMRTLGEPIPIELVYHGAKIPNVAIFPDPPCMIDSEPSRETLTKPKSSRQKSHTFANLPHLSSITATLTSHTRSKSRGELETPPMVPTPHLFSRQNRPSHKTIPIRAIDCLATIPRFERPATIYSSIVFATTIDCSRSSCLDDENETLAKPIPSTGEGAEGAAKLVRRASILSTAPLPPYEWEPQTPPDDGHLIIPPQRHESMVLFATGDDFSLVANNANKDGTDETDDKGVGVDDDDESTFGSRTPTQHKVFTQSESGHEFLAPATLHPEFDSWPPMHVRPQIPFHENGVPMGDKSEWSVPMLVQIKGKT
ncbi:hypothetical protein C0992_006629 [Termitomyces sp. T32_za158]|nr:hypothetical protein C0992_006629 [Termitomyces sp. T32_za158]